MILRLAAVGAIHTAGGVAMGVTGVLALCTVAQVAQKLATQRARMVMPDLPPNPFAPPMPGSPTTPPR